MPTVFSYVLGRPAALQTIEEIPAEEATAEEATAEEATAEEAPAEEVPTSNSSILGDAPES